jgi:hypothetical protein
MYKRSFSVVTLLLQGVSSFIYSSFVSILYSTNREYHNLRIETTWLLIRNRLLDLTVHIIYTWQHAEITMTGFE